MTATRMWIGIVLLGLALTTFSLGLANVTFKIGAGQANIYVSAALALAGVLVLIRRRPQRRGRDGEPG